MLFPALVKRSLIKEKQRIANKIGCYFTKKLRFLGQNGKKTCSKGKKMTPICRRVEEEAEVHISNIKGI